MFIRKRESFNFSKFYVIFLRNLEIVRALGVEINYVRHVSNHRRIEWHIWPQFLLVPVYTNYTKVKEKFDIENDARL